MVEVHGSLLCLPFLYSILFHSTLFYSSPSTFILVIITFNRNGLVGHHLCSQHDEILLNCFNNL